MENSAREECVESSGRCVPRPGLGTRVVPVSRSAGTCRESDGHWSAGSFDPPSPFGTDLAKPASSFLPMAGSYFLETRLVDRGDADRSRWVGPLRSLSRRRSFLNWATPAYAGLIWAACMAASCFFLQTEFQTELGGGLCPRQCTSKPRYSRNSWH